MALNAPPETPSPGTPADKYEALDDRLIAMSTVLSLLDSDVEQLTYAIQNAQIELSRLRNG